MDDIFDLAYAQNDSVFGSNPSPGLDQVVQELVTLPASALDLGCGQGRDTLFLLSKGLHVTAVDRSTVGLSALRRTTPSDKLKNLHAVASEVSNWHEWVGRYDLIVGCTIFDHLDQVSGREAVDKCVECLAANGVIYICVHTVEDPGYSGKGDSSQFSSAIRHYFQGNELLRWLVDDVTILHYDCRVETDYDHGPVHQHGMAYLIGRKSK